MKITNKKTLIACCLGVAMLLAACTNGNTDSTKETVQSTSTEVAATTTAPQTTVPETTTLPKVLTYEQLAGTLKNGVYSNELFGITCDCSDKSYTYQLVKENYYRYMNWAYNALLAEKKDGSARITLVVRDKENNDDYEGMTDPEVESRDYDYDSNSHFSAYLAGDTHQYTINEIVQKGNVKWFGKEHPCVYMSCKYTEFGARTYCDCGRFFLTLYYERLDGKKVSEKEFQSILDKFTATENFIGNNL